MAQTGYTPISIYYSSTAGNTPTAGNLVAGELAINTADGKLFYKDSAGVVQVIAGKGGAGVAGGSNTQVQYNSSGSLAGSANFTFNGTTVTIANDASISGLTVGKGAGSYSTSTALGLSALASNTSGGNNTAIGNLALNANTTASNNTAVGDRALRFNTGGDNSALGLGAMYSNTAGANNTGLGSQALYSNTTASNNTAVGYQAGYSNTTSEYQTYIGYAAGKNWTGQRNTIVGGNSGAGGSCTGDYNTGLGSFIFTAVTSGTENTAAGYGTLYSLTSGNYNSAFGRGALFSNTTASNNTAVGYQALYTQTAGSDHNSAVGYQAGYSTTTGYQNCYFGRLTGYSNQTGNFNAFFGEYAGNSTTGSSNTFIGRNAGYLVTSGSKNVIIGAYAGNTAPISATGSNYIVLSDGDGNIGAYTQNGKTFVLPSGTISSGTGIAFPATQSASSDANTLDDYEEGTWTPTASTNITGSSGGGTYTKVGRLIFCQGYMNVTAISGDFTISGLPFTAGANPFYSVSIPYFPSTVLITSQTGAQVNGSATTITFYRTGTFSGAAQTCYFCFTYITT